MASELGRGAQVRLDDTARRLARGGNASRLIDNITAKAAAEAAGTAPSGNTPDGSLGNGTAADDEVLVPGGAEAGFTFTQAGTGAVVRTVQEKARDILHVRDFGAKGDAVWSGTAWTGTDDAAAINAAFAHVRAVSGSFGFNGSQGPVLDFGAGRYLVRSSINATGIQVRGWGMRGAGAVLIGETSGTPVLDLRGTRYWSLNDLGIFGSPNSSPNVGLCLGRVLDLNTSSSADAGEWTQHRVRVSGTFTLAAYYNLAAEVVSHVDCEYWNLKGDGTAYGVIMDCENYHNLASPFITQAIPPQAQQSFLGNTFINCDVRLPNGGSCIQYIGSVGWGQHRWIGCFTASWNAAAIKLDRVTVMSDMEFDMHCETGQATPGIQQMVLIDNTSQTPGTPISLRNFKLRDVLPNAINLIDATGEGNQILFDGVEWEFGQPAIGTPNLFGLGAGGQTGACRFLVTGRIKWGGSTAISLLRCQFNGELILPSGTAALQHGIGSYAWYRRPGSTPHYIRYQKGALAVTGAAGGTSQGNGVQFSGQNTGSTNPPSVVAIGETDTNIPLLLSGLGTRGVLTTPFVGAAAPTTTEIVAGRAALWKNSADGTVKLYYNDGGTLKSATLA